MQVGASVEEIFEVLKICVSQGAQASDLGVPILAEELSARQPSTWAQPTRVPR